MVEGLEENDALAAETAGEEDQDGTGLERAPRSPGPESLAGLWCECYVSKDGTLVFCECPAIKRGEVVALLLFSFLWDFRPPFAATWLFVVSIASHLPLANACLGIPQDHRKSDYRLHLLCAIPRAQIQLVPMIPRSA